MGQRRHLAVCVARAACDQSSSQRHSRRQAPSVARPALDRGLQLRRRGAVVAPLADQARRCGRPTSISLGAPSRHSCRRAPGDPAEGVSSSERRNPPRSPPSPALFGGRAAAAPCRPARLKTLAGGRISGITRFLDVEQPVALSPASQRTGWTASLVQSPMSPRSALRWASSARVSASTKRTRRIACSCPAIASTAPRATEAAASIG